MSEPVHATSVSTVALSRLTDENAQANIEAMVKAYGDQAQLLEDQIWAVYESRLLANAVGAQIDLLGTPLGCLRGNYDDADYKIAIAIQVAVNRSKGLATDLIKICLLAGVSPQYVQTGPAKWQITLADTPLALPNALINAKSLGTEQDIITYSTSKSGTLIWDTEAGFGVAGWDSEAGGVGGAWCEESGTATGVHRTVSLLSVSPTSGSFVGGVLLTLTGTGFTGALSVELGNAACTSVSVISDTEVQAYTPASSSGTFNVSITTENGTSTLANAYVVTAAFDPTSLSGLVAWYRADKGIHTATGVSEWDDQSGTSDINKNLKQAVGTKQPTFNASDASYNNQPTLGFTQSLAQCLVSGSWVTPIPNPNTLFIIGNFDGTSTLQVMQDGIDGSNRLVIFNDGGSSTLVSFFAGTQINGSVSSNGNPLIIGAVYNGTSSSLFINAKTALESNVNPGSGGANGLTIGADNDGTSFALNGKVAEVIEYNRALTDTEVGQLLDYAGARYGISIGP